LVGPIFDGQNLTCQIGPLPSDWTRFETPCVLIAEGLSSTDHTCTIKQVNNLCVGPFIAQLEHLCMAQGNTHTHTYTHTHTQAGTKLTTYGSLQT
jgi:hypothetical protein